MAFWRQFGGCTTTFGDLCWPAGLEATRLTYGDNRHNHPTLTARAAWCSCGATTRRNERPPVAPDPGRPGTRRASRRRRSPANRLDGCRGRSLQPRPGTDAALALGLAGVIVEDGLYDAEFLDAHANGFDEYRRRLAAYPPERVASITGLEPEAIRVLARDYARTKPALLIAGFGLQRHSRAGQTMRAVALLPALTGNVGRAGGGWQYANLASHCLRPLRLPPEPAAARSVPVSQVAKHLETLDHPPIRAAWIERGNPATQNPAAHRLREALARLDLVVVVDQFMTPTAELAHFVLPAKTLFEEEDSLRRTGIRTCSGARWSHTAGGGAPESEIWRALCERFGYDTSYFPADREAFLQALLREDCASRWMT